MLDKTSIIEPPKILSVAECKEFARFFNGDLSVAQANEINRKAMEMFERYSRRFILPEEYRRGDFHQFFIVEPADSADKVYVAHQTKTYRGDKGVAERLVFLVEIRDSRNMGGGEIRFKFDSQENFFKDKPFVGFTYTEYDLCKQGLGTRRIAMMNGLTKVLFGLPLHSDVFDAVRPKESESPWKIQVKFGNAVRYEYGERHRYCFE